MVEAATISREQIADELETLALGLFNEIEKHKISKSEDNENI